MFICRHPCEACKRRTGAAKDYVNRDVGIVGISSNDVSNYPDDAPESLRDG